MRWSRFLLPVLLSTVCVASPAFAGPVGLYTTPALGATSVPIPDCGSVVPHPFGFSIPFAGNTLTIWNSCEIFLAGTTVTPYGNTLPDFMIGNTIVRSGEDDYLLTFDEPITAFGLRLLTNTLAHEVVTFWDSADVLIEQLSIDGITAPNTRQFVGFSSSTPFTRLWINTEGGALQNEGIDLLEVGGTWAVPDPGSTLLLLVIGFLGLRARRRQ